MPTSCVTVQYDNGSLEKFAYGDGDIDAAALIDFVRLALRRLHANEGEKPQFLEGLAGVLGEHAPAIGQDSAGSLLDRFPEVGSVSIDVARATMKLG